MKTLGALTIALLLTACAGNAPRINRADALKYYSKALDAFQQKEYGRALGYIDTTIQANNRIAGYYELKGDILARLERPGPAEKAYGNALSLRSHYDGVLEKLGDLNFAQKKFEQAVDYYQKAFAQNSKKLKLLLKSAEAYIQMSEFSIAKNLLDDYKKLARKHKLKLKSGFFKEHARLMFEWGKYFTVITDLKVVERHRRLNRNLILIYIQSFYNTGQLEEGYNMATEIYKRALSPADVHYFRALYYLNMKNRKDGQTQLRLALKKGCEIPDAYRMARKNSVAEGELPPGMEQRFVNVAYDFGAFLNASLNKKKTGKSGA